MPQPDLEILLPVHNEAASIEATIRELWQELSPRVNVGFIVCEDGSRDDTQGVLLRLAAELPMRLNLSSHRKGYATAVREGMQMVEAPWLLCLDSDGQCDPADFWQFWEARGNADLVLGWRTDRRDSVARKAMSGLFFAIYQAVFHVPVHDPSCPYVLLRKDTARWIAGEMREMKQGFWWEFVARIHRAGFQISELPVHHRLRSAGATQVYQASKMPGIFLRHVAAIFKIDRQTRTRSHGVTLPQARPSQIKP
jgi:dolichol-phosphate mannosyltransferase